MSRDRASPVCFPGVSCPRRALGLFQCDDLSLKKPRYCRDQGCSIGQCRTRLEIPWNECQTLWLVLIVLADEALARRYKRTVSGDPNQVMWGPKDSERTESMASGCGRTLPEEGQVCRLLRPCSRILIVSPARQKAFASHRTRTSREGGATDTRSQATKTASKDMERPGAPGAQDCKTLGATTPQTPKLRGDIVSATKKKVTRHPLS